MLLAGNLFFAPIVGLNMITREEFQTIYDQGPDVVFALIAAMQATVEAQQRQTVALSARVKELEGRLGKDSHNSSKPPSSDGLAKKPAPKSLRGKSGRRSGGQPGHRGHTLEFAECPDHTITYAPVSCQNCGASLKDAPIHKAERRQVFDLPPTALVVTEHQALTCSCQACGQNNKAEFPANVAHRVQYGPRVKALTTYLMHFQLLPFDRVCTLMEDLFGSSLSEGTLQSNTREAFSALRDVEAAIYEALLQAGVLHLDETGARIAGKLNWLHVASMAMLTYYAIDPRRGKTALDAIGILPRFRGRAIHDGWQAYGQYDCDHGLCNAHHLRELTGIEEQYHQPWARRIRLLLCRIHKAVSLAVQRGESCLSPAKIRRFEAVYQALLDIGFAANPQPQPAKRKGRPTQGAPRSLLLRLDRDRAAVLAFMHDFAVPFDNNQAERDIRMIKVKQKISGCFRTAEGADAFCRIRGYISTMRKQGYDVITALQQVFKGQPIIPQLAL
jgi:transposase